VRALIDADDTMAELPKDPALRGRIAEALAALDPAAPDLAGAIARALGPILPADAPEPADAVGKDLERPLTELLRREAARAVVEQALGHQAPAQLVDALLDGGADEVLVRADAGPQFAVRVTGQPVLDRELGATVDLALRMLAVAIVVVALLFMLVARRLLTALPVPLGLAGAAIASLVLGARPDLPSTIVPTFVAAGAFVAGFLPGRGAITGLLALAAACAVLAFADSPPVRNLAILSAGGLLGAALGAAILRYERPA
jgi:hypothetical protein